ncbi:MAG TPA: NAD(P)H-dependent glycerol-3-phosphate dehydrogenase [Patescibacteria group bacterium]|nr:NAD(P)H-dependent glycerol-3-phosphate dehydrogenase [Patescibacteria group bacterium]
MKIGILGAGGWGTAVACVAAENNNVLLWSHDSKTADEINNHHTNETYLKGAKLPHNIKATHDARMCDDCDVLVIGIPTQFIRPALAENHFDFKNKIVVSLAKGIEKRTLKRVSEILQEVAGIDETQYVNLTGPSHAEEVSRGVPTTVLAASKVLKNAEIVQKIFSTPRFRVYTSQDVVGSEIGGALKNVIAISAGIIDGLGLGDNTKAALMTRGLAEIARLGVKIGADPHTFSGLAGMGDLIVTCASRHSRNRYVGEQIGRGKLLNDILKEMTMVAEGVSTTESAYQLAQKVGVEMPITEQVYEVLFKNKSPLEGLQTLMVRETKAEHWW